MAAEDRSRSALIKRHEQLQRWRNSEFDKTAVNRNAKRPRVKFDDGCVFLAACSSSDFVEVDKLLKVGADINTYNVDGLTALHQAVIDENIEMVEFLLDRGADIEGTDNEGWTPLHAAASCGHAEIARCLIDNGANIGAVNNEGELPIDLADNDEVEQVLEDEIERQGLDLESARNEEEQRMLADANQFLNSHAPAKEMRHSKSGATALHVAAAKGYIKVMNLLIKAGGNVNALDNDAWTPLHGAAHWGQKEAAEVLTEALCDMETTNKLGQTCFDVADDDMLKWLEELKKKQSSIRNREDNMNSVIKGAKPPMKRRSSVTRMSVQSKDLKRLQQSTEERLALQQGSKQQQQQQHNKDKMQQHPLSSSGSEGESSEEAEGSEEEDEDEEESEEEEEEEEEEEKENRIDGKTGKDTSAPAPTTTTLEKKVEEKKPIEPKTKEEEVETVVSSTRSSREAPSFTPKPLQTKSGGGGEAPQAAPPAASAESEVAAWRLGLRKTNSANTVPDTSATSRRTALGGVGGTGAAAAATTPGTDPSGGRPTVPKSASSPRIGTLEERRRERAERLGLSSTTLGPSRFGGTKLLAGGAITKPVASMASLSETSTAATTATATTTTTTTTTTSSALQRIKERNAAANTTATTTTASSLLRGRHPLLGPFSEEKRDSLLQDSSTVRRSLILTPSTEEQESETQRKLKARRERQTRRSTQGVTAQDLQSAEILIGLRKEKTEPEPAATESKTEKDKEEKAEDSSSVSSYRSRTAAMDSTDMESYSSYKQKRNLKAEESPAPGSKAAEPSSTNSTNMSYIRRYGGRATEDSSTPATPTTPKDGEDDSSARRLSAARKRRERRKPTGIIILDDDNDEKEEKENSERGQGDAAPLDTKQSLSSTDRYTSRLGPGGSSRYGDSTFDRYSSSSSVTDRTAGSGPSRNITDNRLTGGRPCPNCKKLFEAQSEDREKTSDKLRETQQELTEVKVQLEKSLQKSDRQDERSRALDIERREKRALERKLSEMEEELKLLEKLKSDNQRLKDENSALVRVISKLSK